MQEEITKETLTFEDFKHQNGKTYWLASEFMLMLGYTDMKVFQKVIDRTTRAFLSIGIDHYENIEPLRDENTGTDYKLTRFACYLCAMNADPKKQQVAQAQAYFATQTRQFELYMQNNKDLDRLLYREDIKEGNKQLSKTISTANVEDYARFANAGYVGLYNMFNSELAQRRGVDKKDLYETMGLTELAANLFRITQTEERIKSQHIQGQANLEQTHKDVGSEIRNMVIKNTGVAPENLPQEKRLSNVKKEFKKELKQMEKDEKTKHKEIKKER